MDLSNKHITIIGAARSGIAAARLVKRFGGIPFVSDIQSESKLANEIEELNKENISFECNGHTNKVFDADLLVVSPGVPSDSPVLVEGRKKKIKMISEIELAYHFCKGKIIAITGTNGKTTTTSLCGHVLKNAGLKVYVAGNIGYAFSHIAADVKENEFVVLEVSSFQLDLIESFKPYIAIILNITPDHLDRYENKFESYINSKKRIYENQTQSDYLIINAEDEVSKKHLTDNKSKCLKFSLKKNHKNNVFLKENSIIYKENGEANFSCSISDIKIPGEHNIANAMAVIAAANILKLDIKKIIKGLSSFEGVEHRLELVRELDGVKYINDSKATNVDSVWYALRSFDNPLFLILGGKDKGNDYSKIKSLVVEKALKVYAIGSSAEKIFKYFHKSVKVEIKNSLEECIISANKEARSGDIVLLSPACASFDMFDNYEHRGKVFKKAVLKL